MCVCVMTDGVVYWLLFFRWVLAGLFLGLGGWNCGGIEVGGCCISIASEPGYMLENTDASLADEREYMVTTSDMPCDAGHTCDASRE
ncbi:hypothetical protein MRB53_039111 [Persea americana]|nr:hypothetical protein MRB53_039111 [Persea americana]